MDSFILLTLANLLLEILVAIGALKLAANTCMVAPNSWLARWTYHPQRAFRALGVVIANWLLHFILFGALFSVIIRAGASPLMIHAVPFLFSLTSGVLLGFAGTRFLAPPEPSGKIPLARAALITSSMIALPFACTAVTLFNFWITSLPAVLIQGAFVLLLPDSQNTETLPLPNPMEPSSTPPPIPAKPKIGLALALGFAPAGMILLLITIASTPFGQSFSNDATRASLILMCIASLFCCFAASVMLFRRKTSQAIVGGVLLLLLNLFISFFFGCTASFIGVNFH